MIGSAPCCQKSVRLNECAAVSSLKMLDRQSTDSSAEGQFKGFAADCQG